MASSEKKPDVIIRCSLLSSFPCLNCARKGLKVSPKTKTKRCISCKYAHYCSPECQRSDWKNHKFFCKFITPEIHDCLDHFSLEAGLFTDGHIWYSIPQGASDSLVKLYKMNSLAEKLAKLAKEKGMTSIEYDSSINETYEKYMTHRRLASVPHHKFDLSLQSDCSVFHEEVYGLVHPKQVVIISEFLREKRITKLLDPLAGSGLGTTLFKVIGGMEISMSDISPRIIINETDVRTANALDIGIYKDIDFDTTAVVVSWPDNGRHM